MIPDANWIAKIAKINLAFGDIYYLKDYCMSKYWK
jgi:hypothetical protein